MQRRRSTYIVVAVIVIAFATVVMSSTLGSGGADATHRMPDGSTMQGDDMP